MACGHMKTTCLLASLSGHVDPVPFATELTECHYWPTPARVRDAGPKSDSGGKFVGQCPLRSPKVTWEEWTAIAGSKPAFSQEDREVGGGSWWTCRRVASQYATTSS